MMAAIKAEFRKLLSVRSTYIVTALVLLLVIFIAGYLEGWRLSPTDLQSPDQIAGDVQGALNLCVFGAIIAILLVTHEYRYNTIMYTLTSSNSRSKVLIAKILAVSAYAVLLAVILGVVSPAVSVLGIHLHAYTLPPQVASAYTLAPQVIHAGTLAWQTLFYGWSYGMIGLLIAVLVRSQVGSIVALFLIPGLVETLLSQVLKQNAVYLPFTAMSEVIGAGGDAAAAHGGVLTPTKAVIVVMCYLVVGWLVAWILFLRRDAN